MNTKTSRSYPTPSIRRLPIYLTLLRRLRDEGVTTVSSTLIAKELKLTGIQVRKDFAMTGIVGRPKVGRATQDLIDHILRFLGWDKPRDAFLIGVGHIGTALLAYADFQRENLNIVAAFDNHPAKIGKTVFGREVLPMSEFKKMVALRKVDMAIITVRPATAQEVTDQVVSAGIRGIWSFAPFQVRVPEGVIVEDVLLQSSLAVLSQKLTQMQAQSQDDALQGAS